MTGELDREGVADMAATIRMLSDDKIDRLVASWAQTIGNDLALARLSMSAEERDTLDSSDDVLWEAAWQRLRERWGDPIAAAHGDVPARLSELARAYLVAAACSERLEPDRAERLAGPWRRAVPPPEA